MSKKVFTIKVRDQNPVHTRVAVYNYGGFSGVLTINTSDLEELRRRLESDAAIIHQEIDTVEGGATVVGATIGRLG